MDHPLRLPLLIVFSLTIAADIDADDYRRGDANGDGATSIDDAVFTLYFLFLDAGRPPCMDAADANDDGQIDLGDPIRILYLLFLEGWPLPAPYSLCGPDPTPDGLDCSSYPPCVEGYREAWAAIYHSPGGGSSTPSDLAVDGMGAVYVTGISFANGTSNDWATIKYGQDGDELWVARVDQSNGQDDAEKIAVDGQGNAYVVGMVSQPDTGVDCTAVKYSAAGDEIWRRFFRGETGPFSIDWGIDVALDSSGTVIVLGNSLMTFWSHITLRYDLDGHELGMTRYATQSIDDDKAAAIAVDGDGNIYTVGTIRHVGTVNDYLTVKYDASGGKVWSRLWAGPGGNDDRASAVAVDREGNVYVTGASDNYSTSKCVTVKYDRDGGERWVAEYTGPGKGDNAGVALAVDGDGSVVVVGSYADNDAITMKCVTIKYDLDGNALWAGVVDKWEKVAGMAMDRQGNVFIVGTSMREIATIKYDIHGAGSSVGRFKGARGINEAYALEVDGRGNVYVAGATSSSGSNMDYVTIKYFPK